MIVNLQNTAGVSEEPGLPSRMTETLEQERSLILASKSPVSDERRTNLP